MSSNPVVTSHLINGGSAANADSLEAMSVQAQLEAHAADSSIEATGGWDAYEVWRRFIKDARDRRKPQQATPTAS
jgi:hypothetical protein